MFDGSIPNDNGRLKRKFNLFPSFSKETRVLPPRKVP